MPLRSCSLARAWRARRPLLRAGAAVVFSVCAGIGSPALAALPAGVIAESVAAQDVLPDALKARLSELERRFLRAEDKAVRDVLVWMFVTWALAQKDIDLPPEAQATLQAAVRRQEQAAQTYGTAHARSVPLPPDYGRSQTGTAPTIQPGPSLEERLKAADPIQLGAALTLAAIGLLLTLGVVVARRSSG